MRVRCVKELPGFTVRKTYETKIHLGGGAVINDEGQAIAALSNLAEYFEVVTAEEGKQSYTDKQRMGRALRPQKEPVEVQDFTQLGNDMEELLFVDAGPGPIPAVQRYAKSGSRMIYDEEGEWCRWDDHVGAYSS